jgi:hypothetical protein
MAHWLDPQRPADMNVSRGLFRAWVLVSVLWPAAIVIAGYFAVRSDLNNERYQYSVQLRAMPSDADQSKSLYELVFPPQQRQGRPTLPPSIESTGRIGIDMSKMDYMERIPMELRSTSMQSSMR